MDYMSSIPSNKHGNHYAFVVVYQFSKMAILISCKRSITIEAIVKLFFEWVWVHILGSHRPSSQIGVVGS